MSLVVLSQGKEEQRREERTDRDLKEVKNREKGKGFFCITFFTLQFLLLSIISLLAVLVM